MSSSSIAKFRKYARYHVGSFLVENRLGTGHSDYEKFIILGLSRSGSNLLRDLLNAHSGVITFGELLRNDDALSWNCPVNDKFKSTSKEIASLIQNDPVKLMETMVFGRLPKHVKALGFKLFYYHAQGPNLKPVWTYLRDDKSIKILHLKRKNLLKRYVSLVKAKNSNVWRDASGRKTSSFSVTLDFDECRASFEDAIRWQEESAEYFRDHGLIDVIYEDLATDCRLPMMRVQEFLNLPYEDVQPTIYKQSKQTLSESITNYSELKTRFAGTRWIEYFED
jgi:LPS sulfotransferase NodH